MLCNPDLSSGFQSYCCSCTIELSNSHVIHYSPRNFFSLYLLLLIHFCLMCHFILLFRNWNRYSIDYLQIKRCGRWSLLMKKITIIVEIDFETKYTNEPFLSPCCNTIYGIDEMKQQPQMKSWNMYKQREGRRLWEWIRAKNKLQTQLLS